MASATDSVPRTIIIVPLPLPAASRAPTTEIPDIALDPDIIFLDEPTAGLDPKGAEGLDDLVLHLRDNMGLTILLVTHDLDTLWHIADRVCFLAEGEAIAVLPMEELVEHPHPIIQQYFSGPRGALRKGNSKKT